MISHAGEFAALTVAVVWTITALAFEYGAKRVGSLNVNLIRLPFALLFLCIFTFIERGRAFPVDATSHQWFWLGLSGLVGFVFGDLCLFKAFVYIGSRFAMLIMTLVPPLTALMGWLIFGETLTWFYFLGMMLTISGIVLAVNAHKNNETKRFSKQTVQGIFFAIGGALGQSGGLILSKIGMKDYSPFAATQIRIITAIIGFSLIMIVMGRLKQAGQSLRNREGMKGIVIGSFFGPFIGVSLSLFAIQHTNAGIASTIMSIVPVLIIFPSVFMFKQRITLVEIIGAILSVAGVALFFV
jgi:drug/metabolite transporter (DMT)-like permease